MWPWKSNSDHSDTEYHSRIPSLINLNSFDLPNYPFSPYQRSVSPTHLLMPSSPLVVQLLSSDLLVWVTSTEVTRQQPEMISIYHGSHLFHCPDKPAQILTVESCRGCCNGFGCCFWQVIFWASISEPVDICGAKDLSWNIVFICVGSML